MWLKEVKTNYNSIPKKQRIVPSIRPACRSRWAVISKTERAWRYSHVEMAKQRASVNYNVGEHLTHTTASTKLQVRVLLWVQIIEGVVKWLRRRSAKPKVVVQVHSSSLINLIMINRIRNYFKNDEERKGICKYCGKYTEDGSLYIKQSRNNDSEEILVCSDDNCYWQSRRGDGVTYSIMSKKERLSLIIGFTFCVVSLSVVIVLLLNLVR